MMMKLCRSVFLLAVLFIPRSLVLGGNVACGGSCSSSTDCVDGVCGGSRPKTCRCYCGDGPCTDDSQCHGLRECLMGEEGEVCGSSTEFTCKGCGEACNNNDKKCMTGKCSGGHGGAAVCVSGDNFDCVGCGDECDYDWECDAAAGCSTCDDGECI